METSKKEPVALPFSLALLLAAACGFIALAFEMVWARLFNFASGSSAPAFAAMLGGYLFGLALGSLFSQRWQRLNAREDPGPWRALAGLIVASNIVGFLIPPVASWLILTSHWVRFIPLVVVSSALLGTILPLLCHLVISADSRAGARMSYIYLANIIGSGAGSLITGFVLMDWLKLWQIAAVLLMGGVLISAALLFFLKAVRPADYGLWIIGIGLACSSPLLHDGLYERLLWKTNFPWGFRFDRVIESRHGVITVTPTNLFVYGNGIYDGVIKTRLQPGSMLVRPYFISALHPDPGEVLVIGMSAGAWTQILAHHPQVEKVTVVEISHGYLKLVREYPQVSSLLTNAKVEIHIDDGRRWLRRNPDRHFDVIVMNTTYHWREFASALLSKEFLELVKQHLNPGGLVMWNCTGSPRAIRTGLEVFPCTLMVANNCVGSLTPLIPDRERWAQTLRHYRIDGQPVFDLTTPEGRQDLDRVVAFLDADTNGTYRVMYRPEMMQAYGAAGVITDDNLGDEYMLSLTALFQALFSGPKPPG
jgi:predicted membrane-bound spermidine synthase